MISHWKKNVEEKIQCCQQHLEKQLVLETENHLLSINMTYHYPV